MEVSKIRIGMLSPFTASSGVKQVRDWIPGIRKHASFLWEDLQSHVDTRKGRKLRPIEQLSYPMT